ncbi:MAG: hypothetical protein AAF468_07330 [Pseudomonadota bacterium]
MPWPGQADDQCSVVGFVAGSLVHPRQLEAKLERDFDDKALSIVVVPLAEMNRHDDGEPDREHFIKMLDEVPF